MSHNYIPIVNDPYYTIYYNIKDVLFEMEQIIINNKIDANIDTIGLEIDKDDTNYKDFLNIIRATNFIIFKFNHSQNVYNKIDYMNELYNII